ncbi:MAG: hypothetical protein WAV10_03960 [Minisyncoccia bacterium]
MANKVNTIEKILEELNGEGKIGPWYEIINYFSMPGAELGHNIVNVGKETIATKLFYNEKTGEIKSFIAKYVDDNANELLP